MTTFGSNQNQDWTATQAAPWRTPSPDAATMGAYYPPTAARQAYSPAFGQAQMAWSAEQPEFNSAPAPYPTQTAAVVRPSQRGGVSGRRNCRRRCRRTLRCTARLVEHAGEHRGPDRTGTCPRSSTGTGACRPAGAQLPDVALDGVERRIHRPGKPSGTAADSAGPAGTAQRRSVRAVVSRQRIGSLAVEQQRQLLDAPRSRQPLELLQPVTTTATTAAGRLITTTADRLHKTTAGRLPTTTAGRPIMTTAGRLPTTTAGRRTVKATTATRPDRTRAETRSDNNAGAARPQGRAASTSGDALIGFRSGASTARSSSR